MADQLLARQAFHESGHAVLAIHEGFGLKLRPPRRAT
jgi:hypothetical protein